MLGINKVILIGHVGNEIKARDTKMDITVVNFSLATTEYFNSTTRTVEWHHIVAFGKTADYAVRNIHVGDAVYIEGCIRKNEWLDHKSGGKKSSFQIKANRLLKLYARKGEEPVGDPEVPDIDDDIPYEEELQEKEDELPF